MNKSNWIAPRNWRYTISEKREIIKLYMIGELSKNIAIKFNCHPSYPSLLVKRYSGICRTKRQAYENAAMRNLIIAD